MRRTGLCLMAALTLVACGDSPTGTDGSRINGSVTAFGFNDHLVSIGKTGLMTVRLSWSNPAIDLDLYLTSATCAGYPPVACDILEFSDDVATNVEQITHAVQSGEEYKVWVDNFDENFGADYQIRIDIE